MNRAKVFLNSDLTFKALKISRVLSLATLVYSSYQVRFIVILTLSYLIQCPSVLEGIHKMFKNS